MLKVMIPVACSLSVPFADSWKLHCKGETFVNTPEFLELCHWTSRGPFAWILIKWILNWRPEGTAHNAPEASLKVSPIVYNHLSCKIFHMPILRIRHGGRHKIFSGNDLEWTQMPLTLRKFSEKISWHPDSTLNSSYGFTGQPDEVQPPIAF